MYSESEHAWRIHTPIPRIQALCESPVLEADVLCVCNVCRGWLFSFVMAEQAVLHLCSKEGGDYAITVRQRATSDFIFAWEEIWSLPLWQNMTAVVCLGRRRAIYIS